MKHYSTFPVLNLKQAAEQLEDIMDRFEAGDKTPVLVGRWGRPPYAVIMPYDMYKGLLDARERLEKAKETLKDVQQNENEDKRS